MSDRFTSTPADGFAQTAAIRQRRGARAKSTRRRVRVFQISSRPWESSCLSRRFAAWRDWPANFHVLLADGAVAWGRAHRSGGRPRNCSPRDAAARLLIGALGHRQTEASPYVGFCHSAARPSPPWFEAGRVDWIPTSPGATRRCRQSKALANILTAASRA
jgi:hypothetical protein